MKVFISQPMKGKTKEEIEADSALACRLLELAGHEVRGGYKDDHPKTKHEALWCLGASLKILSRCDALYYIGERDKNTELPRGCEAEIHCAGSYGIPVFYGEEGLRRLCFQGLQGESVMKINFMKTHPDAVIPTRGSAGAAAFDLAAVSLKRAADIYIYDTGLALEIPTGYWGGIYARSSLFFTGLEKCGGVCVVDSDYRGSILVIFREVPGDQGARRRALHPLFPGKTHMMCPYKPGDRIAQLIIQPCVVPTQKVRQDMEIAYRLPMQLEQVEFVEVPELSTTARGSGGYGSTGR